MIAMDSFEERVDKRRKTLAMMLKSIQKNGISSHFVIGNGAITEFVKMVAIHNMRCENGDFKKQNTKIDMIARMIDIEGKTGIKFICYGGTTCFK